VKIFERWLAPERHTGWALFRCLYGLAMLAIWLPRGAHFEERYTTAGAMLRGAPTQISDLFMLSPGTGWLVYGLLLLGAAMVIQGRFPRLGAVLCMTAHVVLCQEERLNYKGYDRLMFWQGLALFMLPGRIDGETTAVPIARYYLTILFLSMYGSTGWYKILDEPGWRDGTALASHMLERNYGLMPLGVWASTQRWIMLPMSWGTLVFEGGFPLLWLIRWTRPWLLLLGLGFHLGILLLMNVPNFTWASLVAYPLLLNPEQWGRVQDRIARLWG
jgi:hypothetical protein